MGSLELIGLKKRYGAVETLKGVDIAIGDGEFLVLLGPSGCGKSTILNIVAGLMEPTGGDVRVAGRSVLGVQPKNRDVAMVFQSYALYPNLSVGRNIGFGLEMRRYPRAEREAAVHRVAEMLQISDMLERRPADLSGGQRQRVAIGRALVRDPALFLFDEPLSNLDAKLRTEMRTELKRLHQSLGTTMVYVTHDQIEAMTLATRIAVLRDGRIEQIGSPDEVYRRPASMFVAEFVGSPGMNLLLGTLEGGNIALDGAEGSVIPLPLSLPPAASHDGGRIVVGIRPEKLTLAADAASASFSAQVDVVEMTGREKLVYARIGDQKLLAALHPDSPVAHDRVAHLTVDLDAVVLFDPKTGRAVDERR